MELTFWWMPFIALAAAVAGVGVYVARRRRERDHLTRNGIPVAHGERLTSLPAYQRVLKRYRRLLAGVLVLVVALAAASVLLAARPSAVTVVEPQSYKRDIVLCLDVSGSMTDADAKIASTFASLAKGLDGERIGLTIFDSSAVQVFPLTDDYDYVQRELNTYRKSFESQGDDGLQYWTGTDLGKGASLIGDGLSSCVLSFDGDTSTRPRSIILATDNYVNGSPIFTLKQAGAFATKKNVRVYAVDPVDTNSGALDDVATELKNVAVGTGGSFYALDDSTTVPAIVSLIDSREAGLFTGTRRLVVTDDPGVLAAIALFLTMGVLVLLWRVRL